MPLVFHQIILDYPDFPHTFHAYVYRYDVNTWVEGWADVQRWCEERFGEDDPDAAWFSHQAKILFRKEDDALEFKLRWV